MLIYCVRSASSDSTISLNIESWDDVSKKWKDAYKFAYERSQTADAYKYIAEMSRYLSYSDKIETNLKIKELKKSKNNYERASKEYGKKIENQNDINSAMSAEMNAKYTECRARLGECNWNDVPKEWEKVTLTKPSYVAYAKAKMAECKARTDKSFGEVEKCWEQVKVDKELKMSFSEEGWNAYVKFACANIATYQYLQGKINWKNVSKAWTEAAKEDLKIGTPVYIAFAAEALMRAKDKNFTEKLKRGEV